MDVQTSAYRFDSAAYTLPGMLREPLLGIAPSVKAKAFEIRLRVDKPVTLTCPGQTWFVDKQSQLHNIPRQCFVLTPQDLAQAVVEMCSFSIHAHQQEFVSGYISLKGGHRAGICGTAVRDGDKITAIRDITSINLRIAREVKGISKKLAQELFSDGLCGVLVVGVPSSGKTTVLRDLARQLAGGDTGKYTRVAVVDERGELGAVYQGVPQNDLGDTCDILSGYPKGEGILNAVRTLSPQVIICDEIGSQEEVEGILDGLNCGVNIIASAHGRNLKELLARPPIRKLLEHGAFDRIVRLGAADTPGQVVEIIKAGELLHEDAGINAAGNMQLPDGDKHGLRFVEAGQGN